MVASATALFSLKRWLFRELLLHIHCFASFESSNVAYLAFLIFSISIGFVKFSPCFASPRITQGCSLDFLEDGFLGCGILESARCSEAQSSSNFSLCKWFGGFGGFSALRPASTPAQAGLRAGSLGQRSGPPPGSGRPQGRFSRSQARPSARPRPAPRPVRSGSCLASRSAEAGSRAGAPTAYIA